MADILLRELSNGDIDWLVTTGERCQLKDADILIHPDKSLDSLYLLLEGELSVRVPGPSESSLTNEIAQLSRGELLGESWLFNENPVASVSAIDTATVLSIPRNQLLSKLEQDIDFAAHFYRALALIMSERLRRIFEDRESPHYGSSQVVKEALFVFSELRDSDIDWMIRAGKVNKLTDSKVLLQAGRPVDALYTVLDGQLAIATTNQPCDPLSSRFQGLGQQTATQQLQTLAYISRGGLPGIVSFLDFQPLPVVISAVKESLVLAIPRQQVLIKLQEDMGFSSRFYRVIATQMSNLLRAVVDSLGSETAGSSGLDDELDLEALQQISHGGTKFDWMLRQLGVGCG